MPSNVMIGKEESGRRKSTVLWVNPGKVKDRDVWVLATGQWEVPNNKQMIMHA